MILNNEFTHKTWEEIESRNDVIKLKDKHTVNIIMDSHQMIYVITWSHAKDELKAVSVDKEYLADYGMNTDKIKGFILKDYKFILVNYDDNLGLKFYQILLGLDADEQTGRIKFEVLKYDRENLIDLKVIID